MGVGVLFFPCPLKVILLKVTTSESHLIKGKFPQHLPEIQMEGAGFILKQVSGRQVRTTVQRTQSLNPADY